MKLSPPAPSLRSQLLLIAIGGFVVGHMLNFLIAVGLQRLHGSQHLLAPVSLIMFLALLAAVAWLAARVTRPLRRLTDSADQFSGAGPVQPVTPEGPPDVRRAIDAFNAMSGRIGALLEEKDQMLGALGHDLRTPLASIRVRAASMRPVSERAAVFATVDSMERMIDDILTLARTGRSAEPVVEADVRGLVRDVAVEFSAQGASVTLAPGPDLVWPLRPDLLTRAIRNLVDNAVRYGGDVQIRLVADDAGLSIIVEDDGPGIPEDQLEAVLRPFERLDRSRNRRTGGAGLGLAIAVSVARLHDGDLRLLNRQARGLTAKLWLPY